MITSIPGFKPVDDGADAPKPTPMVATQISDVPAQKPELIGTVAPKPLIDNEPADHALLGIAGTNIPQVDPVVPPAEPGPSDAQISHEADDTIAKLEADLNAALAARHQSQEMTS